MDMLKWAEKEIELACKRENPDWDGESFDYGCSIYQSVLKGYKAMLEDDHSGFSWAIATDILNRLMKNKPLTAITEDDFKDVENAVWEPDEYLKEHDLKSEIQCPRMSSLFRSEHNDGTITYTDVDRYFCFDVNDEDNIYTGGGAGKILDSWFPITLPYFPETEKYKIACEDFLVDKEMGDFDTKAYWYIVKPNGERVWINMFYKEVKDGLPISTMVEYEQFVPIGKLDEDGNPILKLVKKSEPHTYQPTKWVEITKKEFEERKANKIETLDK